MQCNHIILSLIIFITLPFHWTFLEQLFIHPFHEDVFIDGIPEVLPVDPRSLQANHDDVLWLSLFCPSRLVFPPPWSCSSREVTRASCSTKNFKYLFPPFLSIPNINGFLTPHTPHTPHKNTFFYPPVSTPSTQPPPMSNFMAKSQPLIHNLKILGLIFLTPIHKQLQRCNYIIRITCQESVAYRWDQGTGSDGHVFNGTRRSLFFSYFFIVSPKGCYRIASGRHPEDHSAVAPHDDGKAHTAYFNQLAGHRETRDPCSSSWHGVSPPLRIHALSWRRKDVNIALKHVPTCLRLNFFREFFSRWGVVYFAWFYSPRALLS